MTISEVRAQSKPIISIIIPVFNEQETINKTISHLGSLQASPPPEIIIIDGDGDKSTISSIRDCKVITTATSKGRARQMNRGANMASGEILLFLHADTFLPVVALDRIQRIMKEEQFVAGAFNLGISSNRKIFKITEWYVALRTRLTRIPFGDQAIFIRRSYFEKMGGFRDVAIMEDIELMARIRKQGDSICILAEKVITSPRRWEREGILYCTLRNWALQLAYALGVSPDRLGRWYR